MTAAPLICIALAGAARAEGSPVCARTIRADIVAIEQAYLLNRFSAFVPAGMLFALATDVVALDPDKGPVGPGNAMLRPDKRPRPIVLRVNEGDCLEVKLTNYLSPVATAEGGIPVQNGGNLPGPVQAMPGSTPDAAIRPAQPVSVDMPRTRAVSFHITGMAVVPIAEDDCPANMACGGDGSNVGLNRGVVFRTGSSDALKAAYSHGSLALPGQTVVTKWLAEKDGAYFAYSMGAPIGGEGDGGQIGLGLFGAVNVEPAGSAWYRSQVRHDELVADTEARPGERHPYAHIDYEKLNLLRPAPPAKTTSHATTGPVFDIAYTDLNAIIVPPPAAPGACTPDGRAYGSACVQPFREFTVIFHDEVHAQQAFPQLEDENDPLSLIKDGMGINYGVSSMGSALMATPKFAKLPPTKDCVECRAEEFFLSSWANGDPALLLRYDHGTAVGALYPDDPSNVHHSYMGDNVRFRNLHAGPKETHVFHLHAHQWVPDPSDPNASYLDSQTISPGATFSYDIEFGGSGNRAYTPGDSIFHCHLYPHFAQGMWELWRSHDTFNDGKVGWFDKAKPITAENTPLNMNLPDAEIATGTETPALVPIPGNALAPMPSAVFRGYPFYIPGTPGHRPPQPVLDFDVAADGTPVDGGLPRHVVLWSRDKEDPEGKTRDEAEADEAEVIAEALKTGGETTQVIAARVAAQSATAMALAGQWDQVRLQEVAETGEPDERMAMKFHEGDLPGLDAVPNPAPPNPAWWRPKAYRTERAAFVQVQTAGGTPPQAGDPLFYVNGRPPASGAPFADPCPQEAPVRDYRAAFIQTALTYNKHGWFDPQGRIVILENDIKDIIDPDTRTSLPAPLFFRANSGECIDFKSSNFVPAALNADDFQIYTPTDTIGQHIHLVKFDVTSSDGSGNGFNYEDATFSPEEVRDRIFAYDRYLDANEPGAAHLLPKTHPLFLAGGDVFEAAQRDPSRYGPLLERGTCPPRGAMSNAAYEALLNEKHDLCGAQRTTQRWWADPILNTRTGKDMTLRTVFTHDHMGPSSHQQHGLYAALVIEPANSVWGRIGATLTRADLVAAATAKCDDPASGDPVCQKLVGGSDLARPSDPAVLKGSGSLLEAIEPRPALKLRADGGPTSTMANIFAPRCVGDSDSAAVFSLQPASGLNHAGDECANGTATHDTRREFDLAIADFGIAYDTALQPINPEPFGDNGMRDKTAIRFGTRHVYATPARPLAISSEDPGSQYFNYRNEPLALRLSEATPDADRGGWNYAQNGWRASLSLPCATGDQDCLGDPANAFSTAVHARRDQALATEPQVAEVTPSIRALYRSLGMEARLDGALDKAEQWRRDFNCALYAEGMVPGCADRIVHAEPWRQFGDPATPILPAYEGDPVQIRLIQGAQEAQHVFTMNGVKWHRLPGSGLGSDNDSGFVSAQPIGISEHFEFDIPTAHLRKPVSDYLYFGSSTDQLWDGLWGIMRVFGTPDDNQARSLRTSSAPVTGVRIDPAADPSAYPAPLGLAPTRSVGGDLGDPCNHDSATTTAFFQVSAVRACDLQGPDGACDRADRPGILYNRRLGLEDPDALVYVLEGNEAACTSADDCDPLTNAAALAKLRAEFTDGGRPLQPLVLHVAAGQCVQVKLRNLLPATLDDGPRVPTAADPERMPEARASYNFLPMITDGFNVNDFRTSSSVGLSPTGVFQSPVFADGSNVGLNGARAVTEDGFDPFAAPADRQPRQGSLVPPCVGDPAVDGPDEVRCTRTFTWSVTDFSAPGNPALELGAVPLRSFGDPIKHPGHGLVGALVVGPKESRICGTRFGLWEGPSAEICIGTSTTPAYVDHTIIMQDSVFATRGGLPVENLSGAEEPDDYGVKAMNYATEPLWGRTGNDPSVPFEDRNAQDQTDMLSSEPVLVDNAVTRCVSGVVPLAREVPCDPETPVLAAGAGEAVRLHFVHPGGHTRQQGLAVSGHSWSPYPWTDGSRVLTASATSRLREGVHNGFGPMMATTMVFTAGGHQEFPMDYLIRSQSSFLFDGGLWGILRVSK